MQKQNSDATVTKFLSKSLPVWRVAKNSQTGSTEILTVLNHLYNNDYKSKNDMVEPVLAETITSLALQSKEANAK